MQKEIERKNQSVSEELEKAVKTKNHRLYMQDYWKRKRSCIFSNTKNKKESIREDCNLWIQYLTYKGWQRHSKKTKRIFVFFGMRKVKKNVIRTHFYGTVRYNSCVQHTRDNDNNNNPGKTNSSSDFKYCMYNHKKYYLWMVKVDSIINVLLACPECELDIGSNPRCKSCKFFTGRPQPRRTTTLKNWNRSSGNKTRDNLHSARKSILISRYKSNIVWFCNKEYGNERQQLHNLIKIFAQKELSKFHWHINIIVLMNHKEMAIH